MKAVYSRVDNGRPVGLWVIFLPNDRIIYLNGNEREINFSWYMTAYLGKHLPTLMPWKQASDMILVGHLGLI